MAAEGVRARWYVAVGKQTLVLDSTELGAMAAAVPIRLVDLVEEIRTELAPLFEDGGRTRSIGVGATDGARRR